MLIINLDGMAFNGNAFLSFQIHIVKYLVHHISVADSTGALQQAVGQGRFAVVNMCNDAKISDVLHVLMPQFSRRRRYGKEAVFEDYVTSSWLLSRTVTSLS